LLYTYVCIYIYIIYIYKLDKKVRFEYKQPALSLSHTHMHTHTHVALHKLASAGDASPWQPRPSLSTQIKGEWPLGFESLCLIRGGSVCVCVCVCVYVCYLGTFRSSPLFVSSPLRLFSMHSGCGAFNCRLLHRLSFYFIYSTVRFKCCGVRCAGSLSAVSSRREGTSMHYLSDGDFSSVHFD